MHGLDGCIALAFCVFNIRSLFGRRRFNNDIAYLARYTLGFCILYILNAVKD